MSPEEVTPILVAWEKALAAGQVSPQGAGGDVPAELRPKLERDWACMQLLRQLLCPAGPGDTPLSSPDLPFTHLGRFEIRRELGRGTYGRVFLAYDPRLGREVALKVPRPEAALVTPELRDRFLREARAAAGLDHPNLVPVYEAGEVGPVCYIASAFCPGTTLAAWLKERREPVPAEAAAQLLVLLAEAMHHAHSRGVVHRDLKPGNILLVSGGVVSGEWSGSGVPTTHHSPLTTPKITDFGLAKLTGVAPEGQTESGTVLGTPAYMAPEQAGGHSSQVGPAADVYALGAILYEVLVGRPPFQGETALDTLEQVRSHDPVPPRRLRPKLPRDLETVCLKCLHKDPAKRYASAQALAEDLGRFLAGEAVQARPVRLWERGIRWARRRPAAAALLALGAGAAAALLAVILAYNARLHQANTQLQQTNQQLTEALGTADRFYRMAFQAIDDFAVRVSQDKRLRGYDLVELRQELLQSAQRFYRQLVEQRAGDPALRTEQGKAYLRLAELAHETGSWEQTVELFREAVAICRQLARDHPGEPVHPWQLAASLHGLGLAYAWNLQWGAAETAYREAQELLEKLVQQDPGQPLFRVSLAAVCEALGARCQSTGRKELGQQAYRRGRDLLELLVAEFPTNTEYQRRLAWLHCHLGDHAKGLAIIQAAADQHPREPGYQAPLAEMYHDLGLRNRDELQPERRPDLAEVHWCAARYIYARLARRYPAVLEYQENLAHQHNVLGLLYQETGRPELAEDALHTGAVLYERLVREHPHIQKYQVELANVRTNLAILYKDTGRPDLAEAANRAVLELRLELARRQPGLLSRQSELAVAYNNLGDFYADTGQPDRAEVYLTKARDLAEKLAREHPDENHFAFCLAATYCTLGNAAYARDQRPTALAWYAEAQRGLEAVLRKEPHAFARQNLAEVHWRRATALDRWGRGAEALPDWDRAIDLANAPDRDPLRAKRARTLARLGRTAEAITEAELLAGQKAAGETWYQLACVHALAAAAVSDDAPRAESYAARALDFLTKARGAGHFKGPAAVRQLQAEPDLTPLRPRAEFQRLLDAVTDQSGTGQRQPSSQPQGPP